jgi:hypothetical protein
MNYQNIIIAVILSLSIGVIYGRYSMKEPRRRPRRITGPRLTDAEWEKLEAIISSQELRHDVYAAELMKQACLDLWDELDEVNSVFELQQRRMAEATALWRKENPGNDLVWPDLGTLLTWLMERSGQ